MFKTNILLQKLINEMIFVSSYNKWDIKSSYVPTNVYVFVSFILFWIITQL